MPGAAKWEVELAILPVTALTNCQVRFRASCGVVAVQQSVSSKPAGSGLLELQLWWIDRGWGDLPLLL